MQPMQISSSTLPSRHQRRRSAWLCRTPRGTLGLVAAVWVPPEGAPSAASGDRPGMTARELWLVVLAGLIWAIYNAAFISVIAWTPGVLTAAGLSAGDRARLEARGIDADEAARQLG